MKKNSVLKSLVGRLVIVFAMAIIVITVLAPSASAQGNGACPNPYTVQARDTLSTIAEKCGVSTAMLRSTNLKTIRWWNGNRGDDNTIHPGQKLVIPMAPTTCWKEYMVKAGDTLGEISIKVGQPTWKLMLWNGIAFPKSIRPGDLIKYK